MCSSLPDNRYENLSPDANPNPSGHHLPHPRETPDRCSLRADLRGDPLLGTAFPASRLLLVEQPGPWGRDGLRESHFDRDLAARVEAGAGRAGYRVEAIRHVGRTYPGAPRRFAIVDTRDGAETLRWGAFDQDRELLDLVDAGALDDGSVGVPDPEPVYLVCTHGKHDPCCALRGRPVAAALHAVRPDRVWECSHLGGDRFAANVLVLPVGLLYGRVLPLAAAEFVEAAEAGEVIGALLRGRVGLASPAQAALAFAHDHLALRRRRDLQIENTSPVVDRHATVRMRTPHGRIDVTVQIERVDADGLTCANPRPNQYLRYRPTSIVPVEDD